MTATGENHPQFSKILAAFATQTDAEITAWAKPQLNRTTVWRWRRKYAGERAELVSPEARATVAATVASALQREGLLIPQAKRNQTIAIAKAATEAALSADPFIAHVSKGNARRERWMDKAETDEDYRALAALDRNDISALELHARLANRLDSAPAGTSSTFVLIPIAIPAAQVQALPMPEAQDVEWREVPPDEVANRSGESE